MLIDTATNTKPSRAADALEVATNRLLHSLTRYAVTPWNMHATADVARRRSARRSCASPGYVSSFRIGHDGGLRPLGTFEPAAPLPSNSAGIAIAPDGQQLYIANFNATGPGTLSSFTVDRTSAG
jgi:hypothetical protein